MAQPMKRIASAVTCFAFLSLASSACAVGGDEDGVDAKGTIAFVSQVERGSAIFISNPDGSGRRQLTRQRTRYEGVETLAWSPSGARIAYSAGLRGFNDDAYDDVHVIPARGGDAQRLTNSREDDWNPAWSPDGRTIAFDRQDDGYNWVYAVNADGTGLRRLTANFNWQPVWSPDGRITYANGRGVWVMNTDGSGKRLLASVGVHITGYVMPAGIAWSPDGTLVAFTTGTALWVMDADGKHRRKLYGVGDRRTQGPVWSPDGTMLAWTQGDGDLEVFVIDAAGRGPRNLTDNAGIEDTEPTWSPDSRALAFLRKRDGETDVYVMNADGSGQRNLSETPAADWSPVWSP